MRIGWVTTYRGDDGSSISVPGRAVAEGPVVSWRHVDGPLMTWAGQMHWLTFRERLRICFGLATVDGIAAERWPYLAALREELRRR